MRNGIAVMTILPVKFTATSVAAVRRYCIHVYASKPTLLYQSENWTLTSKERQMLTTTDTRCLRKAAGKTRIDKIRNEEIRRRVNMQPAEQTANKNKIRSWSHVKRRAPKALQRKALHPEGRRPRGRPRNRWEDDVPRWYKEMGIPMTDVNNWVHERRPIVYPLDADGRSVRLM